MALTVGTGLTSLAPLTVWPRPAQLLAIPVLWATTGVVAAFMVVEARSVGWRRLPWCLGAAFLLGPGCGLSLFLFLRNSGDAGSRLGVAWWRRKRSR